MNNKDVSKLSLLYEDLAGEDRPQYAGQAGVMVAPIGTETMSDKYVEVPEVAGKDKDKDDEDLEDETDIEKILANIKDTIRKYEDKKSLRYEAELEEGFGSFVADVAGSAATGLKSGDPVGHLADTAIGMIKKGSESEGLPVGSEKGPKPKEGLAVQLKNEPDVTGVIGKVSGNQKTFMVHLVDFNEPTDDEIASGKKYRLVEKPNSDYVFAKTLGSTLSNKVGWNVVNVQKIPSMIASKSIAIDPTTGKPDTKTSTWGGEGFADWVLIPYADQKTPYPILTP